MPATRPARVVAITGASAGIGRAMALRLARDGARVSICARRRERLDTLALDIAAAGGEAHAVVADVTSDADVARFVASTIERFGHLDAMICNAGYGLYGAIETIDPEAVRRVMDVNYLGTYRAMHAVLPHFRSRGRGHIIVVSSIAGRRGIPFMGAYAATKFAQTGLVECLRAELHGTGIHATLVCPVSTETEFFDVMTAHSGFTTKAHGPRQSAARVADAVADAIERPVPEVYPYWKARGLVWLNAIAPGLCDRLVRRWGRQPIAG